MRKLLSISFALAALALILTAAERQAVLPAAGEARLSEEIKYVALTFDDGPRRATTEVLLDGLRQRGAHATFFLIGQEIQGREDLILRMQAEGHQIGNHTWSHVRLEGDAAQSLEEIQKTEAALDELLGEGLHWLRPPYGSVDAGTAEQISVPMVKWSVDPRDWESRSTPKVVRAVLKHTRPGDIILLHDIYPTSVEAALQVIDRLSEQGYCFVTVEELLRLNGKDPQLGTLILSGR